MWLLDLWLLDLWLLNFCSLRLAVKAKMADMMMLNRLDACCDEVQLLNSKVSGVGISVMVLCRAKPMFL